MRVAGPTLLRARKGDGEDEERERKLVCAVFIPLLEALMRPAPNYYDIPRTFLMLFL